MSSVFDEFITSAKCLVDAAGKKTDDVMEISKMKYQCVQLNSQLKGLYEKLGGAVYTMVKSDFDNKALMDSLIEEIDSVKGRLDELNRLIAVRKNIRLCPACGSGNTKDSCYCNKCGNKLEADPLEEEAVEEAAAEPAETCCGTAEEAPTEEAPAEEAPTEEAPAEEAPTEEAPTEEAPAEETLAQE